MYVGFVDAACFLFGEQFDVIHFIEVVLFRRFGGLGVDEFVFVGFDEGGDDVAGVEGVVSRGVFRLFG